MGQGWGSLGGIQLLNSRLVGAEAPGMQPRSSPNQIAQPAQTTRHEPKQIDQFEI